MKQTTSDPTSLKVPLNWTPEGWIRHLRDVADAMSKDAQPWPEGSEGKKARLVTADEFRNAARAIEEKLKKGLDDAKR
jgi:hypothetical protein